MVDPRIMARELKDGYGLYRFIGELETIGRYDVIHQVYNAVTAPGAKVVRTRGHWDAIPELMGWNAPNFCK